MEDFEQSNPPKNGEIHRGVPILPLRDTVIFPQSILPLAVGRESLYCARSGRQVLGVSHGKVSRSGRPCKSAVMTRTARSPSVK